MKRLFYSILILCLIVSCKKEIGNEKNRFAYVEKIKNDLKDSLSYNDFASLNFKKAVLSKIDSIELYLLRIPFTGKGLKNDFILLKTSADGRIEKGKIIHLDGGIHNRQWEGDVTISSLDRKNGLQSPIENGYITALHQRSNLRTSMMDPIYQDPYVVLPEVIVVATYESSGGISYSDWAYLQSFFYDSGGGTSGASGYYGSMDGSGGGGYYDGSGGGYGGTGGYDNSGGDIPYVDEGVSQDPLIEIEAEYIYSLPSVDISKMFKCFDNVPSTGASFSIKLCSDLPSNSNPNASANFSAASGGHSFLTVTKSGGGYSVTQSFGFYPASSPAWYDPFLPVTSSIKDNGAQEINASIAMGINESQFNTIKQNAIAWSQKNYQLADYNCSDYAIDIFNSVRSTPLSIPGFKVILPGNTNPWVPTDPNFITINKSPQMLFLTLQEMKRNNSAEASNIVIDQTHNSHAPISKGECN
jgi:hypothetical protein